MSLQYDPLFDQIAEARAEDDLTIPMGDWSRPAKRTDLALVLSLTRNALERRSKDLWLAVWFGEATIKSEGLSALPFVLDLLQNLQQRFWETLFPEGDRGDLGARSAPLQWALTQYTRLLQQMPLVTSTTSLLDYRRSRLPSAAEEREAVDAAIASTTKTGFFDTVTLLSRTLERLRVLQSFCDDHFGEDSPSFVPCRTAAEEALNAVETLLRLRRESNPEEPEPELSTPLESDSTLAPEPTELRTSDRSSSKALLASADSNQLTEIKQVAEAESAPQPEPAAGNTYLPRFVDLADADGKNTSARPEEWQAALKQLHHVARSLAQVSPTEPLGYLLLASAAWSEAQSAASPLHAPSSSLRRNLRLLQAEQRWAELFTVSIEALTTLAARAWLDLHYCVWLSAVNTGATLLARNVVHLVRALLDSAPIGLDTLFEDGTPVATAETRAWLTEQVLSAPDTSRPVLAQQAGSAAAAAPAHQAATLAESAGIQSAVALLLTHANSTNIRRQQFLAQREIAALCINTGEYAVAARLLTRLAQELDSLQLEAWEGADFVAEVLALLLRCPPKLTPDVNRQQLLHRLTLASPLRALQLAALLHSDAANSADKEFA